MDEEPMGLGDLIHKMLTEYEEQSSQYDEETRKAAYMQNSEYFEAFTKLNHLPEPPTSAKGIGF
jgi:hypothetical protein